ncbi:Hypothetical predicted protein [Lecanosticta acicola]|uniref:Uncharacterized protein n=1 Tax=Lecanosticta acicola TaxID=111012 RepID=A0AAI9EFF3_9PEZI|nr:Hypothetical predicted protein [Lecanosticta acicola]
MDTEGSKETSRDATRTEITKRNAIASPLLRLPAELRSEIIEYVLCNRNIHIGIRRRQPLEDGGYPREVGDPVKLMHSVCLCPRSFSEAYRMSLQPESNTSKYFDERGHLKPEHSKCDDVLQGYYTDHKPCNAVLHDLQWREYMSFPGKECRCPFPCIHYFQYRKSMIEKYGEPPAGLEIKYASTKYNLSLLQVCRQIHKEAALLPYASNTFAFQNRFDMNLFLGTVLFQEQRDAIQTLNVCIRSPVNPTLPAVLPPNLKTLECFIDSADGINVFVKQREAELTDRDGPLDDLMLSHRIQQLENELEHLKTARDNYELAIRNPVWFESKTTYFAVDSQTLDHMNAQIEHADDHLNFQRDVYHASLKGNERKHRWFLAIYVLKLKIATGPRHLSYRIRRYWDWSFEEMEAERRAQNLTPLRELAHERAANMNFEDADLELSSAEAALGTWRNHFGDCQQ